MSSYNRSPTGAPAGIMAVPWAYDIPAFTPGRLLQTSCFGACSTFTHVTACVLAKSPEVTLYTGVLQPRCYLHDRSDCYRPGGP